MDNASASALKNARSAMGISQSELARRAGISRQALSAIESGAYQPSVQVALNLAHALGRSVESIFGSTESEAMSVAWDGGDYVRDASKLRPRVALARVGGRLVAVAQPTVRLALEPATGLLEHAEGRRAEVKIFRSRDEIESAVLIAGCDPAAPLLAQWLTRMRAPISAEVVPCSSRAALDALRAGRAHVAGVHMRDPKSGQYNHRVVREALGSRRCVLVNFVRWQLGIATASGNPRKIRELADLSRPNVAIVNRERGAGARAALDEALAAMKVAGREIKGYGREVSGHLEVAAAIASGEADAGVTIEVAAEAFGLGFVPLREECYDLVVAESAISSSPVNIMLDALSSGRFGSELSAFCGYDTSRTGQIEAL